MTIDHDGIEPLYLQLAAILRDQIKSGELPPGRAIPAESRLMQIHEVGRDTVRKAVRLLRDEGLVVAVQGRGTFVAPQEPSED
ncbi:GntR family transcriptional regulator [Nonomuraea terrae]|uniref:GntR family transcriptional regulator n=1 Tax=Nonomuraea terrae TaxID=2530383 RepID=A0A4R4Z9G2_9ACTN|nr:winged helix-turn-helix domain-containing protein [Nonomuraea terrae]TDD54626.1 GntR family transcriptional regulator [Nonomuraea terrae]